MGFNTWNTFGPDINEQLIRETADAMVDRGLLAAGYEYLVIDDCWSLHDRDPITHKIVADPKKFPNGMKAVADYVHSKGLKFGMYSCAGIRTCAGYPGSFDHEFLDAETFAEFGCDFLKYDFCYLPPKVDGNVLYNRMGMALKACGREILLSACNWGRDESEKWMRSTGAHMYRSTYDINDSFKCIKDIAMSQVDSLCYSVPGCFNDLDMLTVGMYGKGNVANGGCENDEYYTHFALWCLFSSPLMIGCDIRNVSDEAIKILTNKELIRINQDPECRPPFIVSNHVWESDRMVFMKHLSDNEFALGFFNLTDDPTPKIVPFMPFAAGLSPTCGYTLELTDIETGECVGRTNDYIDFKLGGHCCRVFRAKFVKD